MAGLSPLDAEPMKPDAPSFGPNYLADEDVIVNELLKRANPGPAQRDQIQALAVQLVEHVRERIDDMDGIDAFMKEYDLSSREGILLMCLAEALLRIPDSDTAEKLIKDKILEADWKSHLGKSDSLFVNASTWGLMLTGKIIDVDENKTGLAAAMDKFIKKSGEPVIRQGVYRAMQMMGKQFVMGRTIAEAIKRSGKKDHRDYRHSYDMLGEAALTQADADRYLQAYLSAIDAIAKANSRRDINEAASISIKLSALHPRYEMAQRERVLEELVPRVQQIAENAHARNVAVTVDAEEADRLELSLQVFAAVFQRLPDCRGFGLVVQAYQKRALPVLHWLKSLADARDAVLPVRLVKGAYWDTEIKRAQEQGLSNYPVFTRKANTDVSYLACAEYMLANRNRFYPQFATHNANTVAAVHVMAGGTGGYEFQRLHGMGQTLHRRSIAADGLNTPVRVYAPVGSHEDLLPYLVRRLLENGANTSFVNRLTDLQLSVQEITADPLEKVLRHSQHKHPALPLPAQIFAPARENSMGLNLPDSAVWSDWQAAVAAAGKSPFKAESLVPGQHSSHAAEKINSPARLGDLVGWYTPAEISMVDAAVEQALKAWPAWRDRSVEARAACLLKVADLLQQEQATLAHLLCHEAGKTVNDCIAEIREAIDFCRYYAAEAEAQFSLGERMPGPTGESNVLYHQGKGVFVCISPWNFPLAIFTGQIAAALVTGNCVIAKPAEQTPLIAWYPVSLMQRAGVPEAVVQLLLGSGEDIGAPLTRHPDVAGVVFTGSTDTARAINRALAERAGPLPTLVAETGGQNCMIADSSALPEQLVKDVIASAFGSAGQRCSALRVLFIQRDVADKVIALLQGAMAQLSLGHPALYATDIGPLIDQGALNQLQAHAERMQSLGRVIKVLDAPSREDGFFFPPHAVEIDSIYQLKKEVFGPFLHVIRFAAEQIDDVIAQVNGTGYGLTVGVHSRIDDSIEYIIERIQAGNCYINRNMIGAVVGVQPFGGMGLSGTGPKAGGPGYLHRFMNEKTVTNNLSAVGGNADLLELNED